jgi:hypothetical protein
MSDMGGKTLDGQKTEACRVWACRIQKCFKENMYNNMDTACSWEIASLKTCCSKHGANSLHCAFPKEQEEEKQEEEKQEEEKQEEEKQEEEKQELESTVCTKDDMEQLDNRAGMEDNSSEGRSEVTVSVKD